MNKIFRTAVLCTALVVPARGITCPIITLTPQTATVTLGDVIEVDINISGLTNLGPPSVGAFDLDVVFDSTILSPTDVQFGYFLGDPSPLAFETLTEFSFLPGVVDLAQVLLLTSAELDLLQSESFGLATLTFVGISTGSVEFYLSQVRVDDAFGDKLPIPEPPAILLLGLGIGYLATVLRPKGAKAKRGHAQL